MTIVSREYHAIPQRRGEHETPIKRVRVRSPEIRLGDFLAEPFAALANAALAAKHGSCTGFPSSSVRPSVVGIFLPQIQQVRFRFVE